IWRATSRRTLGDLVLFARGERSGREPGRRLDRLKITVIYNSYAGCDSGPAGQGAGAWLPVAAATGGRARPAGPGAERRAGVRDAESPGAGRAGQSRAGGSAGAAQQAGVRVDCGRTRTGNGVAGRRVVVEGDTD